MRKRGNNTRAALSLLVVVTLVTVVLSPETTVGQERHSFYTAEVLVSNTPALAPNADSSLVNPWGLAHGSQGPWWVVDEGKGRVTLYSESGISFPGLSPAVIMVPESTGGVSDYSAPSDVVFNATTAFALAPGMNATFLFATLDGSVLGWNRGVAPYDVVPVIDNSPSAVYTGLTTALSGDATLYVANFSQGRIEAYGPDFSSILLPDKSFTDTLIPDGFSPYNIKNMNGLLYVTFAEHVQGGGREEAAEGSGYVDAFDSGGNLVVRLEHGPWMAAPWGIAPAPPGFGDFSARLLVGNAGSGRIASFDPMSGEFLGYLPDAAGAPLTIPGLHGIGFGNNGLAGPETTLYFTAGTAAGRNAFGSISPSANPEAAPTPGASY